MERFFAERGFVPKIGNVMSSNETIKQAVMAGMGLAFISRHTIGLELQTGRLVELDVVGLPLMRRWYVVHRAGRFVSPATTAFVEFVVESAPRAPRGAASASQGREGGEQTPGAGRNAPAYGRAVKRMVSVLVLARQGGPVHTAPGAGPGGRHPHATTCNSDR